MSAIGVAGDVGTGSYVIMEKHGAPWKVVIGVIGIGIGIFAFSIGSKVAGTICVLTNIPVLAYRGFIGAFFYRLRGGARIPAIKTFGTTTSSL
jgi:hypothetical protein